MKIGYQVRYRDIMSNKPMSEVFNTFAKAQEAYNKAYEEILNTWATPDTSGLYIETVVYK